MTFLFNLHFLIRFAASYIPKSRKNLIQDQKILKNFWLSGIKPDFLVRSMTS